MSDKPILFSGPMVRALLEGRKTQTRRVLTAACDEPPAFVDQGVITAFDENDRPYRWPRTHAVGDRLWVREAWRPSVAHSCGDMGCDCADANVKYAANDATAFFSESAIPDDWTLPKAAARGLVPGIHMPRWASRLTLVVTEVRVQRLKHITQADAIAEGVEEVEPWEGRRRFKVYGAGGANLATPSAVISFSTLWDSLHEKVAFESPSPWDQNPCIAAYTFTVHACNIDQLPAAE